MQVVFICYFCTMSKVKRRSDCPINYVLEIFGDKWAFLIIRDLIFKDKSHYNEFLQSEEKIATNILADRLLLLEESGIIIKKGDPSHGSKWIYSLSKKGMDLLPLLVEMIIWSAKHDKHTAADKKFVAEAIKNKEDLIAAISRSLNKKAY